jgi:hypothetical protein
MPPLTPPPEFDALQQAYHDAAGRLAGAIPSEVMRRVLDVFPDATALRTYGEVNEDGVPRLHLTCILTDDGTLANDDEPTVAFEALVEDVEPLLDLLLDITGDDWMGGHLWEVNSLPPIVGVTTEWACGEPPVGAAFTVLEDEWNADYSVRTIKNIKVLSFGPVLNPPWPDTPAPRVVHPDEPPVPDHHVTEHGKVTP